MASELVRYSAWRPSRRTSTSPTSRSTPRCFETDGCGSFSAMTISPTDRSRGGQVVEDVAPPGFRDRVEGVGRRGRAGHESDHIPITEYVKHGRLGRASSRARRLTARSTILASRQLSA